MITRFVALAGILGLPLVALGQPSGVAVYGRINLDVEQVSGIQGDGTNPRIVRVSSNTSRIGVRGIESLGGGLYTTFQVESSVNADAGGGTLAGRETYIGLQGPWGTIKMGGFLTPYDDVVPIFGNVSTLTTSILSTAAIWGQGPLVSATLGSFDARLGNSIRYDSPDINGFTASLQGATLEGNPTSSSRVLSAGLFYTRGALDLGGAYQRHVKIRAANLDDQAYTLAGSLGIGPVRPAVVFERTRYDTPGGDLRRDFWGASVSVTMGAGTWYAFYGRAGDGKGSAPAGTRIGGLAAGPDSSAAQYELSYSHALSQGTTLYAGYVRIDNGCNASYTFNINAYAPGRPLGGCFGTPTGWLMGIAQYF